MWWRCKAGGKAGVAFLTPRPLAATSVPQQPSFIHQYFNNFSNSSYFSRIHAGWVLIQTMQSILLVSKNSWQLFVLIGVVLIMMVVIRRYVQSSGCGNMRITRVFVHPIKVCFPSQAAEFTQTIAKLSRNGREIKQICTSKSQSTRPPSESNLLLTAG